jgi:hypothetical protein
MSTWKAHQSRKSLENALGCILWYEQHEQRFAAVADAENLPGPRILLSDNADGTVMAAFGQPMIVKINYSETTTPVFNPPASEFPHPILLNIEFLQDVATCHSLITQEAKR